MNNIGEGGEYFEAYNVLVDLGVKAVILSFG
jgi:hypothetical protein